MKLDMVVDQLIKLVPKLCVLIAVISGGCYGVIMTGVSQTSKMVIVSSPPKVSSIPHMKVCTPVPGVHILVSILY